MLVAVAILLAVMTMVGVIFNTASKSSGLAQAMNSAYRDLRNAGSVMREDLDRCLPAQGILAIAGVEVLAHSNAKDAESNRDLIDPTNPPPGTADPFADVHRADVLMFTTDRDIQTYVFRQPPRPQASGDPQPIEFDPVAIVTYGHADVGELEFDGSIGQWRFRSGPKLIESAGKPLIGNYRQSDMPSYSWHLARRVLRFPARTLAANQRNLAGVFQPAGANYILVDPAILEGQCDVYVDPYNDPNDAGSILPLMGQGYFHYGPDATSPADDYAVIRGSAQGRSWWYRLEIGDWFVFADDFWFGSPGANATNCGAWQQWTRKVAGVTPDPPTCAPDPLAAPPNGVDLDAIDRRWAFYVPTQTNRRTVLDPTPPAGAGDRMGAYFLPNCSDFLVEYTYDDPAELFLAPDSSGNWRVEPQAPVRWQSVRNGEQMVWSRLSVSPKNYRDPNDPRNRTDPIRWPRALRITLRAYGPGTTLEDPVEQVIVHTFQ